MNARPFMTNVALLTAILSVSAIAQQTPQTLQALPPPLQQGSASVEGAVVRAGSVPPALVARARVVLSSIPDRANPSPILTRTVATDDSGHFLLRDIPPGIYNLMATRDGYSRATTTIGLDATQFLTGVALELTPTSAISGRIRNRAGTPVANVSVQAQRYSYREGRRILTPVQTVLTNDLGEFRLYYLTPGRYVVSAKPDAGPVLAQGAANTTNMRVSVLPGTPAIGTPVGSESNLSVSATVGEFLSVGLVPASLTGAAYVSIYFPGTMDATAATPIDLKAGEDFAAADFIVSEVRAARVTGKIVNGVTGEPASGTVAVMLMSRDTNSTGFPPRQTGTVAADGTFEFRAVPPGSYDVIAMIGRLPPGVAFGASGTPGGGNISPGGPPGAQPARDFAADSTGIRLATRVPIQVRDADIGNLILSAQVGHTVKGRVTVEGRSAEESQKLLEGAHVQLQPDPEVFETAAMPAPIRPDGTFTAVGATPGTYRIWVMGASGFSGTQPYVKSATLAGVDVINPRFVIERDPVGELEVVISLARGSAQVSVVDAKQAPAKSVVVVFVPEAPRQKHFDLYQRGQTNDTGTTLMSMPIGDYVAYAFQDIEPNSWWDPEVMQKYAGQGVPVRLASNGRQAVNLKLIPSR